MTFQQLKNNYPTNDKNDLFTNILGGGWPVLINNNNYKNTCAIRISVMLNRLGGNYKITKEAAVADGNHKDKDGNYILISVKTSYEFLKKVFGDEYWGISKQPGQQMDLTQIGNLSGIILYHAAFSNASGHIDLWDRGNCYYNCPPADINLAYTVGLWKF